jgi:K319-like protein/beta-propeller repeat-containing protein/HYR domain-containing protein
MTRTIFLLTLGLSLLVSQFVSANQPPSEVVLKNSALALEKASPEAKVRVSKTYGKLPLAFEANEGQMDAQVKFLSRGSGYSLFLTPTETVLSLSKDDRATAIRMGLVGANPKPKMAGEEKLPSKTNYFIGKDPKKWRTNVSNYKKVRYEEVYPGIDLVYYGNQRKLEYDFIVKPGVNPKAIRMQFAGVDRMSVEAGDLILHTDSGNVIQKTPIIYQEIDGKRKKVMGNYMFLADNQVGFYLGDYDKTQPLVIDPVLEYSTYLGGSGGDQAIGIAVDSSGNAYVTGQTSSTNFPTVNPISGGGTFSGNVDGFVSKLSADGSSLIYSTYIGGSGLDRFFAIAVDNMGNAYMAGQAGSSNFPTLNPIPGGGTFGGGSQDGVVTKLNAAGNALIYSTYLGGNIFDAAQDIALDGSGNVYIAGWTSSTNFPTVNPIPGGGTFGGGSDGFVSKLNPSGNALIYSTYLGGSGGASGEEQSRSIAVDSSDNAYVAGFTNSTNFPTTNGAFDKFHNGGRDAFVSKLSVAGSSLIYSTYLGGSGSDTALAIAVDALGNAYVTGSTNSTNFLTQGAIPGGAANSGSDDAFVSKLNLNGNGLLFSTYLGGSAFDRSSAISVDGSGNAYIAGWTASTNFPTVNPISGGETFAGGDLDGFVSKIDSLNSTLAFSTYQGGSGSDFFWDLAIDNSDNIIVVGGTDSANFPVSPGSFDNTLSGPADAIISKIGGFGPIVVSDAGPDQTVDEGVTVNLDGTGSSPDPNTLNFAWSQTDGPAVALTGATTATPSFTAPEVTPLEVTQTLTFQLIVDDGTNFSDPDTVTIIVNHVNKPPVADAGADQIVEQQGPTGSNVTLSGSGSSDPDSDPLTFTWTGPFGTTTGETPTVLIPAGINIVTLIVNDSTVDSAPDTVQITVQDTTFPVVTPPADITVPATGLLTPVLFGTATATDAVGVVSLTNNAPAAGFPIGTTTVLWIATDAAGNSSSTTQQVTVSPFLLTLTVEKAKVKLNSEKPNHDKFEVKGTFAVFANSDGFDLSTEDVIVVFGDFSQTIPAGSFVRKDNKWKFKGSDGGIKKMEIKDDGKFKVEGKKLNLGGNDFTNPILFSIDIGNDFGETSIQFDDKLKFKNEDDHDEDDD